MIKKNNIVFSISSLSNGGAEKQFVKQLYFLSSIKDYNIHIIILKDDYFNLKSLPDNVVIHKFKLSLLGFFEFYRIIKLLYFLKPIIVSTWLIHANILIGLIVKLFCKSQIFWNIRGEFIKNNILSYIELFLSYFIPNIIIVNSKYLSRHYLGYKYNNIFKVVYNAFFITDFYNTENNLFPSMDSHIKILYNARFVPSKNHSIIFDFVRWYNLKHSIRIKLICIGKDISLENKKFVRLLNVYNLNEDVEILDQVDSEDSMNSIYRTVDLCLLLSKSEGFPNVIVESILNKIFVLTLNFGSANEIIKMQECIINNFSFQLLSEKIDNLFFNNHLKNEIIENNYIFASTNFNYSVISNQIKTIYKIN